MHTLVLNLGLRSIRSIIFDQNGRKILQDWLPVRTYLDSALVEQDPDEWWLLAKNVIKSTVKDKNIRDNIRYITVTAPSCCLIPVDKNGSPLHRAIMVSDKRAHDQAVKIRQDTRFITIFNNANHLAEASFMIPKIMWLKDNKPSAFDKVHKFISANDFFIYKMTGSFVTDYLNAEKFYYDPLKNSYPVELFRELGINSNNLSEIKDIGANLGPLNEDLREELGLCKEARVILTTYDAICAFWGAGVSKEGEASNVCGTSSSLRVYSKFQAAAKESGILSQFYRNENMYMVGGSNNLEGGLLEWARDCFYGDSYFNVEEYLYKLMEEEARGSSVGAQGITFLPYLIGERVPFWDPHVRGVFFGMERTHSRKDIIRSVFESTGFCALSMINAIESCGVPVKEIYMSGGLSQIDFICKLRADITGKHVFVLEEFETTSLGAYMIIAMAIGLAPDFKTLKKIVKIKKEFLPDKALFEKYQKLYELYMDVYRSLFDAFRNRSNVLSYIDGIPSKSVENL